MLKHIIFAVQRLIRKPRLRNVKGEINQLFELILQTDGEGQKYSQTGQDVFALLVNRFKRRGYFVDFGATDGVDKSNSYLLEKDYGWRGILAEPAKVWHEQLKINRKVHIETDCVWKETGTMIEFGMTENGEMSSISSFLESDQHLKKRRKKEIYKVRTISLLDLLKKYEAPKNIDFLSIDTEGSELEILQAFDFSQYKFNVIIVEHNYTNNRQKIYDLLRKNGYNRIFRNLSRQDDWFVHNSVAISDHFFC